MNRPIATVLGGNGFIGRQVVERLVARGYFVRVASREPAGARSLRRLGRGTSVLPVYANVTDALTLQTALKDADVSVNLVSILKETGDATFNAINAHGAGRVARVAQAEGVRRHVHVSAIGADHNAPSMYGRSKAEGEGRVRAVFSGATIIRPSIVFGPEDRFLNMFGLMARLSPVLPVFCPKTRLQPVFVGDVAEAIVRSLVGNEPAPPLVEAGGPDVLTMHALMAFVAKQVGWKRALLLPVPMTVAQLLAQLLECFPGRLLTQDQLLMLATDNVVSRRGAATLDTMGITPKAMAEAAPSYLRENGVFRTFWRR